jgi:hypothetical protein
MKLIRTKRFGYQINTKILGAEAQLWMGFNPIAICPNITV